jgi:hypothetical protein
MATIVEDRRRDLLELFFEEDSREEELAAAEAESSLEAGSEAESGGAGMS